MRTYLDFEKPVAELEAKVLELRVLAAKGDAVAIGEELSRLEAKAEKALADLYANLTPWQKTQVARHKERPHFSDCVKALMRDFTPLSGDRQFGEDPAIVGGFGWFRGRSICILGQEKGSDTEARIKHNFGMARPEGYRKAVRLMQLADRFGLPVVTLVDTAGAFPGVDAEERGQAEAIARNLREMARLSVPIITTITGEGGSGGALAIAVADRVLMQENSIYSVISPEGCASIMWRDSNKKDVAAQALHITAKDILELGIADEVIPEPPGGAHHDYDDAANMLADVLEKNLAELEKMPLKELLDARYNKFRNMAQYFTTV